MTAVDYIIADDVARATLPLVTLALEPRRHRDRPRSGASTPRTLTLALPPPDTGVPDFLVHRSRFDAGVARRWGPGDGVAVFYPDTSARDGLGAWWAARIVDSTISTDTPDAWSNSTMWEGYRVSWGGASGGARGGGGGGSAAPADAEEDTLQSPWELYAPGTTLEAARAEAPRLEDGLAAAAMAAVEVAAAAPRWSVFADAPPPSARYPTGDTGATVAYNATIALPLGLDAVAARLASGWYRSPAALASDVRLIAANAATFNDPASSIARDGGALAAHLVSTLALPAGGGESGGGDERASDHTDSDARPPASRSLRVRLPTGGEGEGRRAPRDGEAPAAAPPTTRLRVRLPVGRQ